VLTCKKNILSYKKNATLSKNRETNRVWADLLDKKNPPMLQLKRKNWNLQWFLVSFLDRKTLLEY
jgi:hypothetical protein